MTVENRFPIFLTVALVALASLSSCVAEPTETVASIGLPTTLLEWPAAVVRPRFSPDGRQVAFASILDGSLDVFIADVLANEVRRVTDSPANNTRPAWSPDGSELVFESDRTGNRDLWIITLESGDIRRLTQPEFTETASDWSWAANLITYTSEVEGSWDVWVIRPDGSDARRVTVHDGNEYQPKFSPDGQEIVFYPTWSGWTDIFTVNVSSGEVRQVLSGDHEDFRPDWSPDGSRIIFASDRSEPTGLWMVDLTALDQDNPLPTKLLEPLASMDYPDWTPDGSGVLYVEETYYSHIFSIDLADGTRTRITSDERTSVDRNPDIVNGTSLLAYETTRYGNEGNIALRDLATSEEHRLTSGRVNDGEPHFSPSGERLVFTQGGGDQVSSEAVVWDVSSESMTVWTDRGNVLSPAFCGEHAIVFGWAEVAYTRPVELWYQPEGEVARRIGDHLVELGGFDCSSDGSWIVAALSPMANESDDAPRLIRIDVVSGAVQVITRDRRQQLSPRLSPDGSEVAFVAQGDGGLAGYVVPVAGGQPREVISADRNVVSVAWSTSTTLVYDELTRLERPRLVAVPGG